ncbi:MAG TPA: tetratricopeptide repeat protein [Stellaceae bacterium]|nr:tetratricopeptide repeat protein [Stellaceae bacterium]
MSGESPLEKEFARAHSLHTEGRFDEAEQGYQRILTVEAGHLPALLQLGVLRLQQGRYEDAMELAQQALRRDPGSAEAHSNCAATLHLLARHDAAAASYEAALMLDPDRAEAHYGLGLALHSSGRTDEAIACYERALVIDPDYAEASCALGAALAALRDHDRALGYYRRALDVDPDYVEALCGAAEALRESKQFDQAIAGYRKALTLQPEHAQAHNALGIVLRAAGRHHEALAAFSRAIDLAPDYAEAHHNLGIALEELGRISEAHAAFEQAITIDPANIRYVFALVASKRVSKGDPVLEALKTREGQLDAQPESDRILLHFALGKALSDVGQHRRSFDHLLAGNKLKRRSIVYDEAWALAAMDEIRTVFSADLFARSGDSGHPSALPIFIVGMPRSGSTLVEQILASHAGVFGGGERADFFEAMTSLGIGDDGTPFPRSVSALSGAQLAQLGAAYVNRLSAAARSGGIASAERVTDKMPGNFCLAGLIHLALPNARIIHTCRDPVDTCLSCFSRLFTAEQPFAYDLGELGRYYRACDGLIDHWRRVLPESVFLDVRYEELVADFEPQARRILAHCGLDWDPACLLFHRTERVVLTASATQVRQPLYRSSIGRWRPDQGTLWPLLDALAAEP